MRTIRMTPLAKTCLIGLLCSVNLIVLFTTRTAVKTRFPAVLERIEDEMSAVPCDPKDKHSQFEPCLITYVKHKLLVPPPPPRSSSSSSGLPSSPPATLQVLSFIKTHVKTGGSAGLSSSPGFFIEYGIRSGVSIPPTLALEQHLNWTGLLIEPNPGKLKQMLSRHRNAFSMNAAICSTPHSSSSIPDDNHRLGDDNPQQLIRTVPCVPLYTVIAALGRQVVDYLLLNLDDGSGVELDILKTVPFDRLVFKVLQVGYQKEGYFHHKQSLVTYLKGKGYRFLGTLKKDLFTTQDLLFAHESVYRGTPKKLEKYLDAVDIPYA